MVDKNGIHLNLMDAKNKRKSNKKKNKLINESNIKISKQFNTIKNVKSSFINKKKVFLKSIKNFAIIFNFQLLL